MHFLHCMFCVAVIAGMGSDDYIVRERHTTLFTKLAEADLLGYSWEMCAVYHRDLEIRHRARHAINHLYDYGGVDYTFRCFKHDLRDFEERRRFSKYLSERGWVMVAPLPNHCWAYRLAGW